MGREWAERRREAGRAHAAEYRFKVGNLIGQPRCTACGGYIQGDMRVVSVSETRSRYYHAFCAWDLATMHDGEP